MLIKFIHVLMVCLLVCLIVVYTCSTILGFLTQQWIVAGFGLFALAASGIGLRLYLRSICNV